MEALAVVLVIADGLRPPELQAGARVWITAVGAWQLADPLHGLVACRYRPTCSRFSAEAVARYGWPRGLWMTAQRIASCQRSVPMGTTDPVPEEE